MEDSNPTAAVLVIGDEILSGRTRDSNTHHIAQYLAALGIDLREARVVPDVQDEIVSALNALRSRYSYVFTTGGIGPTHDDITADAIAKAFCVGIDYHPEAMALLAARYKPGDFNEARKRMARIPDGATLIANAVSAAPGFHIGNVFVMAGVPAIMHAMLETLTPQLAKGAPMQAITISMRLPEGAIAGALAQIQARHRDVLIGSYPFQKEDGLGVQLVARSRDREAAENAAKEIEQMVRDSGGTPERL